MNISDGLNGDAGLLLQLLVKIADVICKFCVEADFPNNDFVDLFISINSFDGSLDCQYDGESILLLVVVVVLLSIFLLSFSFFICATTVEEDETQLFNLIFLFDIDLFDAIESFDEDEEEDDDACVSCCIGDRHMLFESATGDVFESLFV